MAPIHQPLSLAMSWRLCCSSWKVTLSLWVISFFFHFWSSIHHGQEDCDWYRSWNHLQFLGSTLGKLKGSSHICRFVEEFRGSLISVFVHLVFLHVFSTFLRGSTETRLRRCVEERWSGDHCQRPGQPNHSILCRFHRHWATYWWCRQESGGTKSWEHCRLLDTP